MTGHDTGHDTTADEGDDEAAAGALASAWGDPAWGGREPGSQDAAPSETDQRDQVDGFDVVDHMDQADGEVDRDQSDEDETGMVFPDVMAFVEEFFAPVFGRDLEAAGTTWCPEWWRHAEAVYRLEALWRAWEHLRQDASLGPASWLRDHLDHQLAVLLSSGGPLRGCSVRRGHQDRDYTLPTRNPYGEAPEATPATPAGRDDAGGAAMEPTGPAVTMPMASREGDGGRR